MARFVAVFEVRVGGESGVRVGRFAQDFTPFDVVESGYPVRVVPVVVRHTEEDYIGPEAELVHHKVPYLDLPRAEVTIELDATPLDKVEGGKVYGEPRRIATEVLVRTLAHIREVLGDVSVNVTPPFGAQRSTETSLARSSKARFGRPSVQGWKHHPLT